MYRLLLMMLIYLSPQWILAQEATPELNYIYGKHHLFTVETPNGWVNDKHKAKAMNLVSFFYPKEDASRGSEVFIYAMGYDKDHDQDTLDAFIAADIDTFKKHNPKLTLNKMTGMHSGAILNSQAYAFENLSSRFKEEVIYMETKHTMIVLVFSALSSKSYKDHVKSFDKFVASFVYRGDDPKPFLDSYDPYEYIKIGMTGGELINLIGDSIDADKDISQGLRATLDELLQKIPHHNAKRFYLWKKDETTYYLIGLDEEDKVAYKHKMYYKLLSDKGTKK